MGLRMPASGGAVRGKEMRSHIRQTSGTARSRASQGHHSEEGLSFLYNRDWLHGSRSLWQEGGGGRGRQELNLAVTCVTGPLKSVSANLQDLEEGAGPPLTKASGEKEVV